MVILVYFGICIYLLFTKTASLFEAMVYLGFLMVAVVCRRVCDILDNIKEIIKNDSV